MVKIMRFHFHISVEKIFNTYRNGGLENPVNNFFIAGLLQSLGSYHD